jgi:hypothetical protein
MDVYRFFCIALLYPCHTYPDRFLFCCSATIKFACMPVKSVTRKSKPGSKRWSAKVNATSNALDLHHGIFKSTNAKKIAESLKRSATRSKRKKGTPYQSAMSMLNFYINRGGKNLSATRKATLQRAKKELRVLFKKKISPAK